MSEIEPPVPKAFISYAWDDDAHKEWVRQLAVRLRADGVNVTLDRWHFAPGDAIPAFMERAVYENDFVIVICTPRFKERSDGRGGGVGYEGDITTVYALTGGNTRKFIPVLRRGSWREAAPTWLLGRAKIDLSSDPYSESEYEELLRALHGVREGAPPIGPRPRLGERQATHASSAPTAVPGALADACAQGQCVLYAGGGVGAQGLLPTWREGLWKVVESAARLFPDQDWDTLRQGLDHNEPARVADLLDFRLERGVLLEILREVFNRPPGAVPEIYALLAAIPFAGVLNSNWDHLLAEALAGSASVTLSARDSERFAPLLREDWFFLVNINGDLAQPETFLFTTEDYRKATAENEWLSRFVSFCFSSKTLFFLGTSPQGIEDFLSGLNIRKSATPPERDHFALLPREADFAIQEELFRTKYGIRLIEYTPTAGYPQLVEFLRRLKEQVDSRPKRARAPARTPRLDRVVLRDIGPFGTLELDLHEAKQADGAPGDGSWNMLLGNNGCGKSTFLRAIALGLCGDDRGTHPAAERLLREGARRGTIELVLGGETYRTTLRRTLEGGFDVESHLTPLQAGRWVVLGFPALRGGTQKNPSGPAGEGLRYPVVKDLLPLIQGVVDWRMDNLKQWIVNTDSLSNQPRLKPDKAARYRRLLTSFFEILAAFIPGVTFKFAGPGERFQVLVDTDDGKVPIDQLSQGTLSVIGWVGTLLQRMYEIYDDTERPEDQPALVLIDEIDAHMHPEWQQLLVPTLRAKFPRLQVIATTHSPLVVLNMKPGETLKLVREGRRPALEAKLDDAVRDVAPGGPTPIRVETVTESLEGQTAAQVLTGPIGLASSRDLATAKLYVLYTQLAARADRSPEDEAKLRKLADDLGVRLPTTAESATAREARAMIEELFRERLRRMAADQRERLLAEVTLQLQELETGSRRPG
jgi:energy-coupling factor transporter ATP-binding protein EcfA2